MSAYTPTYTNTFARLLAYRKETDNTSQPNDAQTLAYRFYDQCIGAAYGELEKICRQPILQRSYSYQYADKETAELVESWYYRKHILPFHTVPLTGTMDYRIEPYSSFTSVDTTLYKLDTSKVGWHVFHRIVGESYRINASIGYTEAAMPEELYMAAVELAQGAILRSPVGDSRLGKVSVSAGGVGGASINTVYSDISKSVGERISRYIAGVL